LKLFGENPDNLYLCNIIKILGDMKKILWLLTMMVGTLTAQAGEYTYLTFETTDGAKASVSVEGLTLSISGTTLTAGTQTFTLSNLSKMYFSNTDESSTTGISEELRVNSEEYATATFYDLYGKVVDRSQLSKGVYIVKTKSKTYKMVVR
jgi:hypothetical protein